MRSVEKHLYEFGEFRLDTAERLLLHNGEALQLSPKVFDMLVVLVQHHGRLLEKDQLMRELWPDTIVEEVNLSVNISALRKVLGEDEKGGRYIETVPKSGYRFVADVREIGQSGDDLIASNRVSTRIVTGALALAATLILVAVSVELYKVILSKWGKPTASFQSMKLTRLTSNGKSVEAAISPDGKYVVYVAADSGRQSLWLRQVASASNVQIVPPGDLKYDGMTFSKDGNFLYYEAEEKQSAAVLYRMPVLGGAASRLIVDVDSIVTFSPDSKRIAFLRGYPAEGQSALIVADADGTEERKLSIRRNPDFFSAFNDAPTWSPDGKIIACPGGTTGPGGGYMTAFAVHVDTGEIQQMTTQHWSKVGRMAWLPDDRGLILSAKDDESSPFQLWYLSYPDGAVRRITNDLNDYGTVSLTSDGATLATVRYDLLTSIWISQAGDAGSAKAIRSNTLDGVEGLSWTPDSRIAYASRTSGNSDIWIMDQDGNNQKQLTVGTGNNKWPSVSGDGRYIVFMSDRNGGQTLWRMDTDGNNPRQLTNGGNESAPDSSPDGKWIVYRSGFGKTGLFKVSIDGGEPIPLNDRASTRPTISPDGKWIACSYFDDRDRIKTAIYPFAGGEPVKVLDFYNFYLHWTPDGRSLAYAEPRANYSIESQPIDGGPSKPLTNSGADHIFRFAWSRDGQKLAMVRAQATSDVVLISNLR